MNSNPLFTLERQGFPEVQVFGEICTWDGLKSESTNADGFSQYPARSLLKPFQFLASQLAESAEMKPWFAAAMGSLSASKEQVRILREWIESEAVLGPLVSQLKLPASYPMDETHRVQLKEEGDKASQWFHTCFSKHLAILQACRNAGWDLDSYLDSNHPYHLRLLEILQGLLGENLSGTSWVADGCKLPTPVLGLDQMSKLFFKLVSSEDRNTLQRLRDHMMANPDWIGGAHRVDTRLMIAFKNRLVAKEGADGLLGVGLLPSGKYPRGLGIVIKLASGYQPEWAGLALRPFLVAEGEAYPIRVPEGQTVHYHFAPEISLKKIIIDISPALHSGTAIWPGDVPFSRTMALDVEQGQHMTLSAIQTTLHIGSHTDAPNHFARGSHSIDQKDLHPYWGSCQVIQVNKKPGSVITPEDFQNVRIQAPRVIFKTGSFPNPNSFNQDFVALSPEAMEYLKTKKVLLVGIDTPSIDPFDSKELSAHHATVRLGISILEGVILKDVPEGVYHLMALPLKIQGGDASPVRAVLVVQ